MKARERQEARRALDEPLLPFLAIRERAASVKSWARATRQALGVPAAEVARRLGRTEKTVFHLERAEMAGRLELETLRGLAGALDCALVYAVVPARQPMEALADEGRALRKRTLEIRQDRRWRANPHALSGGEIVRREAVKFFERLGIYV